MTQPTIPSMSRRSSSLVNALNSFVNLRSSSASSVKGSSSKAVTPKFDLKLEDFPSPPEPEIDETHANFLRRLTPYGKFIAVILCQKSNAFKDECLRFYLSNFFDFSGEPLDISLRKILMFLELPQETQQIDKLLTEFAHCYYQTHLKDEEYCPWKDENQVYFIVFSLLMLHTDYFNLNNRSKMTKNEFIQLVHEDQLSGGCDIPKDILLYYYDNIISKESPKFDFSCYQELLSSEEADEQNSLTTEKSSADFYSPVAIIKATSSNVCHDCTPSSFAITGRTSSNSFSSYFPQIPASTSSSNTSLVQDDIDIYAQILDDSLKGLNMSSEVERLWNGVSLTNRLIADDNKYEKYFTILNETKGGYLKIHKNQIGKIALSNFETLNKTDNDYALLKIVHMGEIQKLTVNKKFSIVGSVNKILWKKEYAILTPCCLLLFENADWVDPSLVRDENSGTSNYIIDYKANGSILFTPPLACNGLLAISKISEAAKANTEKLDIDVDPCANLDVLPRDQESKVNNTDDYILHLYASQKKFIWKCSSVYERDNWIDSINLVAAYDGCYYNPKSLENVIISHRKHDAKLKLEKLANTRAEKSERLLAFQHSLPLYKQAIPISYKTKNDLASQIRQLAVKLEWLVHEIERSQLYYEIIQQVVSQFGPFVNQNLKDQGKESESDLKSIKGSFIFNDELLNASLNQDRS